MKKVKRKITVFSFLGVISIVLNVWASGNDLSITVYLGLMVLSIVAILKLLYVRFTSIYPQNTMFNYWFIVEIFLIVLSVSDIVTKRC